MTPAEPVAIAPKPRQFTALRADRPEADPLVVRLPDERLWRPAVLLALAAGFVLWGGGRLDLGAGESRLGLAGFESFAPLGRAFGGWEPSLWPARVLPTLAWAWGEGGTPTSASVRWPSAIAGVIAGLILSRRATSRLGGRAGLLVGLCWFASLGLMDRSVATGLELVCGLATIAAFDRLLGRGSDLVAGAWAALALLAGGWPPLALLALATVIIGRRGVTLSFRFLLPSVLAAAAWFGWAVSVLPAEGWGAAIALPLTQSMAWTLAPGVVLLGLPWSPFAALAAGRTVRAGWPEEGRALVVGWLQVAGVCLLAGTLVPGLASAAGAPALAGLAVAAGAVCERLVTGFSTLGNGPRRWALAMTTGLVLLWTLVAVAGGGYLAAAVSFYRALAIGLMVACVPLLLLTIRSVRLRDGAHVVLTVFALAVCLKATHLGYYVPETNYRTSQGPWGRAIGQWVPPRWPIYVTHAWSDELAFATRHPFRQIVSERSLEYQPGTVKFVLLLESEFTHWPVLAPPIQKVAQFQDERGDLRVLARTPGDLPWTASARQRGAVNDE